MWQGILGHDEVAERFQRIVAKGRLASSYLFLGPHGVGKRTFALKLAESLLCPTSNPADLAPCKNCESCRLATAGTHPDLSIVSLPSGKSRMPVELFLGDRDHRNQEGLCHDIAMRPMLGTRRVAIIDDADLLTIESSNCLLKTLEEPPAGAVLILLATSRNRLLPTILSRTQVVRFSELSAEQLAELLIAQSVVEDSQAAFELAQQSGGSIQVAQQLASSGLGELRSWFLPQLLPDALDRVQLAKGLQDFINSAGKEAPARRRQLRLIFQTAGSFFSQAMRASCLEGAYSFEPDQSLTGFLHRLGDSAEGIALEALDRCLEAEVELDRNANQATLLECWIDDLAKILTGRQVSAVKS